jgi:hypothetical protein
LKWRKRASSVVRDDSKLLAWVRTHVASFVKVKTTESTDWENLKKVLIEREDHYEYATEDGELIPVDGVELVEQPDVFEIK